MTKPCPCGSGLPRFAKGKVLLFPKSDVHNLTISQ